MIYNFMMEKNGIRIVVDVLASTREQAIEEFRKNFAATKIQVPVSAHCIMFVELTEKMLDNVFADDVKERKPNVSGRYASFSEYRPKTELEDEELTKPDNPAAIRTASSGNIKKQ